VATRTVRLDEKIYRAAAVKAAIRDYSEVSDMKMEKKDGAITVTIENWPEEYEETIELEFCNYILWKMRN
jgi:hypothetical protein